MASILKLPNYVLHKTFLNLDLESIQRVATTCKRFQKIVSKEYFFEQYAPTVNTNKASCKFIEKFGPHLSMKQIVDWNFNRTPEEMKQVVDKIQNNETRRVFFMLAYSSNSYEKYVKDQLPEQMNQNQKKYFYLLKPWHDRSTAIEEYWRVESIKSKIAFQNQWNLEKADYIKGLNQYLAQANDSKNEIPLFVYLLVGSIRYLRIEAPDDLSSFYTELFRRYDLTILHPQSENHQLYPIEVFRGFCNAKAKHIESMRKLSFFNIHLKKFNEAFKDTVVNELDIVLLYDIEKSTLEGFIKLIESKEHFPYVSVFFTSPLSVDAKAVFEKARKEFKQVNETRFTHIKAWELVVV